MYEEDVRVYMLPLLGCFILVDKSHVYIDTNYISLSYELEHVNWAWMCVALTILYTALREASILKTV